MHLAAKQLLDWLSIRPTWRELGDLLGNIFIANFVWAILVVVALDLVGAAIQLVDWLKAEGEVFDRMVDTALRDDSRFFYLLTGVAFLEETIFRFVPLSIVLLAAKVRANWIWTVFPVAIISSVLFGLVHIDNHDVVTWRVVLSCILIQGVGGILMSLLFLKYTGLRFRYVLGALLVTTVSHAFWNMFVIAPSIIVASWKA